MNIGIVGLGLIGGSLAKTIKLNTEHRVIGCDVDLQTILQAQLMDALDEEMDKDNLPTCDMVLVALYPAAIVEWITAHAQQFKPGALVIDCGGVKQEICRQLIPLAGENGWHFIGGHPMAGREFSGFKYAKDDLFDNASMILTPMGDEQPELLQRARDFFMDLGFRRVQFTTPKTHDEMIAYTSQLCHLISAAYVRDGLAREHEGYSSGSFRDMVRVGAPDPEVWTELFFANREALLDTLDAYIGRLGAFRDALASGDEERMRRELSESVAAKAAFGKGLK